MSTTAVQETTDDTNGLTEMVGKPLAWIMSHSQFNALEDGRREYKFNGRLPFHMLTKIRKDLKAKGFGHVDCGNTTNALQGYVDDAQLVQVWFENGSFNSTECNVKFLLTDYRLFFEISRSDGMK